MTLAEILRAGKARLLERGWCQGDEAALYADDPRKCCAATAIPLSGHTKEDFHKTMAACDFLKKTIGLDGNARLADWNDAPERTLEDVLAAYDKAIAAADLSITHAELAAMPMPKAVVAFLRASRTYDEVGDIDGPWRHQADLLLDAAGFAPGCTTLDEIFAWERGRTHDEVFAIYDKAIIAALALVSA